MDDFKSDPFFNSPRGLTFPSFPDPFEHPFFNRRHTLDNGSNGQVATRPPFHSMSMWPFGGQDPFKSMFDDFKRVSNDPNAHSFSSSSVMMYSTNGRDGQPTYYEATSSSSRAPGRINETRKAVQDSQSGVQKLSIGHHIGDRGHVLEHSLNHRTGEQEERRDLLNMDETEGHAFAREWEARAKPYSRGHQSLTYKPRGKSHGLERSGVGYRPSMPCDQTRVNSPAHAVSGRNVRFTDSTVRPSGPTLEGQRARKSKKRRGTDF